MPKTPSLRNFTPSVVKFSRNTTVIPSVFESHRGLLKASQNHSIMGVGIYLHIPFCKSRCSYCDFATDVYRSREAVERYVGALCREIGGFDPFVKRTTPAAKRGHPSFVRRGALLVDTIYFGGGTPSLLKPEQVEKILASVLSVFSVAGDAEITMEMNPATVLPETLCDYRSIGVNRASFGVQTFDDRALKLLARGHNENDARATFSMLREAGFDNISFDLIAGLPGQTIADWKVNLNEAINLSPEHLSLYLLEIHKGTPLAEQIRSGRQPMPDEHLAARMYEMMIDKMAAAGYAQYEISNFSRPGFESRHNTKYWKLEPVYGFGVSAHSFDGAQRYANERDTAKYIEMIETESSAEIMHEDIDLASEYAFLGLRMERGLSLNEYKKRFGKDLQIAYQKGLEQCRQLDLIEAQNGSLRLTRKGKLFSNEVFKVFVS